MKTFNGRSILGPRRAAGIAAAAALVAVTAACGGGGKADQSASGGDGVKGQRFILMVQSTANTNKVVESHAIEIMKQDGVKAEIKFNAGATNVAVSQLLTGDIDVYGEAVTGGIGGVLQGIPLVDFALMQPRQDYVFIAKPGLTSLADLKGKKIGVQDTTGVNYAQALIVLGKAGLTPKDVSIIAAGGQSSRLPAMVAGRVDATMLSHSAQIALGSQGYTVLYDFTKESANLYDDNGFATKNWLKSHPALAVEFNKALLKSFQWFNDPKNADAVLTEALKLAPGADKDQTKQLFDMLRQANAYPNGTILDKSVLDDEQKLFKEAGAIKETAPIADWVDTSFAEKAKSEVGTG
jgi:NitT/TauT family transport system substrate-binding protein